MRLSAVRWAGVGLILVVFALSPGAASLAAPRPAPSPDGERQPPYKAAILMEAETGKILEEHQADARHIPASIVKMMLMLLVAETVKKGEHKLEEIVRTSAEASRMGGSQVYLKQGETFSLEEIYKAVAIASANDASYAIAEHLAGTPEAMVHLMNERARELGMKNTVYTNVHGLPPGRGEAQDWTSARDTALLAREMVRHPLVLDWTKVWKEPFRGGKFILYNTNQALLRGFEGMDGLKTGYYEEAGFNLCATAQRGGMRLISVVFGAPTRRDRDRETRRLLIQGFRLYKKETLFAQVKQLEKPVPVQGAKKKTTRLAAGVPVPVVLRRLDAPKVATRLNVALPLQAPLKKGQKVGEIEARLGDEVIARTALLAAEDVPTMTWLEWIRFWDR